MRFQNDKNYSVHPEYEIEMDQTKIEKYSDDDFNLLKGSSAFSIIESLTA